MMSEPLVIEWSRDGLRLLALSGEGASRAVQESASCEMTEHADRQVSVTEAGSRVREWLETVGSARGKCVVVLPRESVVARRLSLPSAPPEELPDLVRFQAATKTSAPIESLALDYLAAPALDAESGQDVFTFTIDQDLVTRITEVLEAADLLVSRITVSSLTVANLVKSRQAPDLGESQPDLVVYQQGRRVEIAILDAGTLVFSHASQLPEAESGDPLKPLKSELSRSLVALGQSQPNVQIARCYYVSGHPDDSVRELLETRFPDGFHLVETTGVLRGAPAGGYEPLLGAALPSADERLHIDFLHPRKRQEVPDRRKIYWAAGAACLALVVMVAYGLYHSQYSTLEASIESLQEQKGEVDARLAAGKPRVQAYDRVAKWQESHSDTIDLWSTLMEHAPGTDRLYFKTLTITPQSGPEKARFQGTGESRERQAVDSFFQQLSMNGFRPEPPRTQLQSQDPDYPFNFTLNANLMRAGTAAVNGAATANTAARSATGSLR